MLVAGGVKVAADVVEFIWREGRLDPTEDGSLLVANVISEQPTELQKSSIAYLTVSV